MADSVDISQVWSATITIGNLTCPCFQWQTDIGTYGQIGRGFIRTSITALENAGINLDTLNAAAGAVFNPLNSIGAQIGQVNASGGPASNNIPLTISVNNVTIFGGYYLFGEYEHHADEATIHFRDYACVLFDSKTSMASLNLANQTVGQLVASICQLKGLNSQINLPAATANLLVGSTFNNLGVAQGGANFGSYPRSYWSVLVLLARAVGANIYTVPTASLQGQNSLNNGTPGTLIFESQATTQVINRFYWMPKPPPSGVGPMPRPIRRLSTVHQPQRNKSFVVLVKSFHGPSLTVSVASATVNGQGQVGNAQFLPAGVYTASGSGAQVRNLLSNTGLGLPEYEFRIDGLTPGDVQAKAEEIANAIAAKLFIQTLVCDFDSSLKPLQQAMIIPSDGSVGLIGFQASTMYINGVSHSMLMTQGEGIGENGLTTTIRLLNLPPASNPLGGAQLGGIIGDQQDLGISS